MNNAFTPRRWAVAVMTLFALTVLAPLNQALAQCTLDPLAAYAPVPTFSLAVDAVNPGTADLNASVVSPFFLTDCGFDCVNFYTASTGGVPVSAISFSCADVGTTFTYWISVRTLSGNCGTPASLASESPRRQISVTIIDNTTPTIVCPANVTVAADPGLCSATVAGLNPAAGDNCTVTKQTWTKTGATTGSSPATGINLVGGTSFNKGVTTVTYTVSDASNNTASCAFTVTVNDNQPPTVTCPANVVTSTDPGQCSAVLTPTAPTSGDNCGVTSTTWTAPGATPAAGSGAVTAVQFPKGVTTVTYTVSDAAANTATCSFTVTVNDTQDPAITGTPASQAALGTSTGGATPGNLCDGSFTWNHPTLSDNCPGPYVLQMTISGTTNVATAPVTAGGPITQLFNLGLSTVTYLATDGNGETSTTSFTVNVVDNVAPVVTPPAGFQTNYNVAVNPLTCSRTLTVQRPDMTAFLLADCGPITLTQQAAIVNGLPDATFLNGFPITQAGPNPLTTDFPAGTTVLTYTWTDNASNTSTTTITVTVLENEPPVAKCKAGTIVVQLDATGSAQVPASAIDNISTDNCPGLTLTVSPTSFTCAQLPGTHTVTLTATDASANTATCTATVDVVDNLPPQVLCPGSQSVDANNGCNANNIAGLALTQVAANLPLAAGQYKDNCGVTASSITWQLSGATTGSGSYPIPAGQAFNNGVTNVTYTVPDASGNTVSCSFSVSVSDASGPTFTGGQIADITVNANQGGCIAQVSWPEPTVTESCSNPFTLIKSHSPGAFFNFGETTVTYTAIDAAGNLSTRTFKVIVVDTQAPVASCKPATLYLDANGLATLVPGQINNNSGDNCFISNLSVNPALFDCTPVGANISTLTVTDGAGNTATCTATITVLDTIKPTVVCTNPGPLSLDGVTGTVTVVPADVDNGSTDNCVDLLFAVSKDNVTYSSSIEYNCQDLGTQTLYLRVTDASGNITTCSQTVVIQDVTNPVVTPPASLTLLCQNYLDPSAYGQPTVADICDATLAVAESFAITPGACANEFVVTRTWVVTDDSGNSTTVTQTITVEDNTVPNLSAVVGSYTIQTDQAADCDAPLALSVSAATVVDSCSAFSQLDIFYKVDYPTPSYGFTDITTFTLGTAVPADSFPIGTTVVTWLVVDDCGNSSTKTVSVTVQDTQAPVFTNGYQTTCGKVVVLPNTSGACSNLYSWARPSHLFNNVTDCLGFTVTENINNPSVQAAVNASNPFNYTSPNFFNVFVSAQFPVGITTVTYTATDAAGNTSVCSFTVEVEDTQAPVLTCPPNQILQATCPTAQVPNYTNLVQVSDNCSGNVDLEQVYAPGTTLGSIFAPNAPAGGNQFTVTITGDDDYNTTTCSFTVTLQDGDAPIPTVAQLPAIVDSCGTYIIAAPSALDPCNPAADTIYGTPSTPVGMFLPGTPPRYNLLIGNYVITWVYNDGNGNISTQTQNITVLDDVFPPVAICNPTLSVNLSAGGMTALTPAQLNNGSYDPNDCGPITLTVLPDSLDCGDLGPNTITLQVTDFKGNTATCTSVVTVNDVTPPVVDSIPANITVQSCDTILAAGALLVSDVCDDTLQVVLTEVSTEDTVGLNVYNYTITRTWVATDDSGNSTTVTQVVTVADTQAPVFSAAAPDTVLVLTDPDRLTCDDTVSLNMLQYITDCATGDDLFVGNNLNGLGPDISGIYGVGSYTFIFTATDLAGNTSKDTVVVVVRDATPPTAVCINGVSAALQPSGTVVVTPLQFDNNSFDNCTPHANLDLKIQRLAPLGAITGSIAFGCADADGVTEHPVKLYVKDQYGNESSCETYIVIQDNVDPTITFCPAGKTTVCTDALTTQVNGVALATDNCPTNVSVSFADATVPADSTDNFCYKVERTWTAVDLAGNTGTCVQTFNIVDTIAPVLSATPANDTISCSEPLDPPSNITATDNCSDSVVVVFTADTINIAQGPCGAYSYTILRTRTATDDCGNTTVHQRTITVVDDQAPQFLGMPDTVTVFSANFPSNTSCTVPVTLNVGQYLVDCTPVDSLIVTNNAPFGNDSLSASGNYPVGQYLVYFTATDACGNIGQDSVVINVVDNSIPVAICNANVNISLGTNGEATLEADDIDLGSNDNCGIDSLYLSQSIFDCADLGLNAVTLTVVDNNGNTNSCTVNVNVTSNLITGFTATAVGTPESYFGADDGTLSVTVTGSTGPFTYLWSNNATTATVNNVSAGTYFVTVTNTLTGCIAVDTATVAAGAKLNLIVGDVTGNQGDIVQVPVTVDNFNDITAFSFSLNVVDPAIGTIQGITGSNPNLALQTNLVGNNIGVLWIAPANVPLTLPNGSLLFNLSVALNANAAVGSSTPVNVTFSPTGIAFAQDSAGVGVQISMINIVDGSITIDTAVIDEVQIAGDVRTWKNPEVPTSIEKPVPNATVNLTGSVNDQVITGASGTYLFDVPTGSNTTVDVTKMTAGASGVNVLDLLRIVNHIFGATFPSPYQWIAADVKQDGQVSLADYLIIQRLVLGTDQHLLNSPDWRFVPKSFMFPPAPANPLTVTYPTSISHTPALMDFLDDDFVAIRMGDVTGDVTPTFTGNPGDDRFGSDETFRFRLAEQPVRAGETITVPFKASDFNGRLAYQMTIGFDSDVLELTDIQPGALPGLKTDNFGTAALAAGKLTTVWVSREPVTIADDEVLFTLTFRSLRAASGLAQVLHAGSTPTPATAVDGDGNTMKIDFDFVQPEGGLEPARFALYQNQPNPFRGQTTIGFRLPENSRGTLRVYTVGGQLVKTVVGQFDKGYNEIRFQRDELGTPGVYWYELETPAHSDRKKMILID